MTIALLAGGALLCAVGVRVASAAFAAGAVAAWMGSGPMQDVAAWTAALTAGLALASPSVRRLAGPAAGAAAVLVAGSTSNAAVVLVAWVVGSAAAAVGVSGAGRRWAFGVLLADLPLAAAIVSSVLAGGFVSWGGVPDVATASLLAAAALVRAPLMAGPLDRAPEPGLVVVRTQVLVLLTMVARADVGTALIVGGAVAFAAAVLFIRPAMTDTVQEAGLFAMALGGAVMDEQWLWIPLAVGGIIHVLRYAGRGRDRGEGVLQAVARSGGFGSLFLAAAAVPLAGAIRMGGTMGSVVVIALVLGLGGRLLARSGDRRRYAAHVATRAAVLTVAAAAALVLPLVARGLGGPMWPSPWWLALVIVGVAFGARVPQALAPSRTRRPPSRPAVSAPAAASRVLAPADTSGALTGTLLVLGGVAVGLWVAGWWHGFL